MSDGNLWLRPCWREPLGAEYIATHYANALVEILGTVLSDLSNPISTVLQLGELDRSEIWRWNQDLPPAEHTCIQDLISEQARIRPTAQAICSWDGDFSYHEVESYSTLLAHHLVGLGLRVGQIVPICFEKSRWTIVAVLGVMKAGGSFVLMDPSQPLERRQIIAEQVDATLIVTSKIHGSFGPKIAPGAITVVVAQDNLEELSEKASQNVQSQLPVVPTDSILYLIFTSGSTGKPKGVIIDHVTYTTSAITRSAAVGYKADSRVMDFASYAFDVSVDSMLCTMLRGGCLCIPSDEDRLNDLSGVIRRMKITMSNMTPSVARILDADIIPSLHSLGLGGESCSVGDVSEWGQYTRIVVGYGPSECTVGCTINSSAAGKPYVSIGPGVGAVIWLVDPDNHDRLMPIGAVGELLVEGPIVGQGYLGDPEKTAAAFIEDPPWLLTGGGGIPGRKGRLYKTGDLVRYDPDGERGFVFVGRKDTQVKLRGQRVELGEIEHHLRRLLPSGTDVAVEVIAPQGRSKESMLLAFVADPNADKPANAKDNELQRIEFSTAIRGKMETLNEQLSKALPVYMVPSAYVGIDRMPMLVSGKTDRKLLRAFGSQLDFQSGPSDSSSAESQKPISEAEMCLHGIWCRLLRLSEDQVSTGHNFFILGGDSVLAMKLVPAVREQGFVLTVADIFSFPVLSQMAKSMQKEEASSQVEVPPFSLIASTWGHDAACEEAALQCGVDKATIEDIYPCTPLQEILMAFSVRSAESYVAQRVAEIPEQGAADKLKAAWDSVIKESPILRTRVVEFKDHGFLQVITSELPSWQTSNSTLEEFLEKDQRTPMTINMPLSRYSFVFDDLTNKIYFVWTVHHAVYDGWSTDLIVEHASNAYQGLSTSRPAEFKHFIKYLVDPARESSKDYWRVQLQGATGPQYPSLPSRMYIPEPNTLVQRFVAVGQTTKTGITTATLIRAAWALVASQYTMSDDVVFGETFAGRTLRIPGVEQIEGPMIATVPVRVRIDRAAPVQEFLQSIQEQGLVRAAHEHLGMQNIRRVSADAQLACEVKMGLVIQPRPAKVPDQSTDRLPPFGIEDAAHEALRFNSYPLMLACSLRSDGFEVTASFDSNLITELQMQRVLAQLECVVSQLHDNSTTQLSNITCLSEEERSEIWQINKLKTAPFNPEGVPGATGLIIGDTYPTQFVPWIVNSANHSLLMPIGTVGELLLEGVGEAANVDTPDWFGEGANNGEGKLYKTGDLVKYADDKSLIFMGRKESLRRVDGHVMDLAAIDLQLRNWLPSNTSSVCQLIVAKGNETQLPSLVAFVSETPSKDGRVVDLEIATMNPGLPLTKSISTELAGSISGLNKVLADVLPPYMVPSTYIPLEEVPRLGEQIDVECLKAMAGDVTQDLLLQLRTFFMNLRPGQSEAKQMNMKERTLRSLWAKSLGMEEEKLALDDNFFRVGGDSIMAMKLVSALRLAGYHLSVTDIFRNMQLRAMASALEDAPAEGNRPVEEYKPFSLLNNSGIENFLSERIQPTLADPAWKIEDVLPATDPQERDVEATVSTPRSAVQYNMLYFKKTVDVERIQDCFEQLVSMHPILRTVFVKNAGRILQVVLESITVQVLEHNTEESLEKACAKLAEDDITVDSSFAFGTSFLHLFVVRGVEETGLMIRISHAQCDGISFPGLLQQLERKYIGEKLALGAPFSNFIQYQAESKIENIQYWRNVLQGSWLTTLPPAKQGSKPNFIKKAVDVSTRSPETTMATLLTASWARVLAQHLDASDITFGGVVSGRTVDLPGIDQIMGPCYQYMPLRVKFQPGWEVKDLLDGVRDQFLEGSRHATLGFQEISDNCTSWSPAISFFSSVVHHHDIEYFDTMPFADTECGVDYRNPHPESPNPARVVSYTEAGATYVGIAADEERLEFWQARLDELGRAMEEFVKGSSAVI